MKAEIVRFRATDGTKLNGFIYNYQDNKDKIIISTHGMGSNCFKEREAAIARLIENTNISLLAYNNRGTEILSKCKRTVEGKSESFIAGAANENILESHYDIKGAIDFVKSLGYSKIYLMGHSLGSTKTVYTYNKLLDEKNDSLSLIKGVILLSLVDTPKGIKDVLGVTDSREEELNELCQRLIEEGRGDEFMPEDVFVQPLTANEYNRLCIDNSEINFAQYHNPNYEYEKINNISVPLLMRWGNNRELIAQRADDLVQMLNEKIHNPNKDISFIDGADHSFHGFEEILAKDVVSFVDKY